MLIQVLILCVIAGFILTVIDPFIPIKNKMVKDIVIPIIIGCLISMLVAGPLRH